MSSVSRAPLMPTNYVFRSPICHSKVHCSKIFERINDWLELEQSDCQEILANGAPPVIVDYSRANPAYQYKLISPLSMPDHARACPSLLDLLSILKKE